MASRKNTAYARVESGVFKDRGLRKKRKRFLLLSLGMVGIGALIMFYSALISLGFVQMGMGEPFLL